MNTLRLSWRLLRGGGARGLVGAGLTLAAVAVSTALLLFAVGMNIAFEARADRGAWRNPVAAQGAAVAVQSARPDYAGERIISLVEIAALRPGIAPPAGLAHVPAPGEVWMSPALAALARELPPAELAGRFPAGPVRIIGDAGLVHGDELVAVVGRAADDPAMALPAPGSERPLNAIPPTRVAGFGGEHGEMASGYRILALIATVLVVVPLLVFGGAAARLTVARRDQRLAALRLVGATPGQVVSMTVAEAVVVAGAGALAGLVVYALAVPLLAHIPIGGGGWYAGDLWPGALPVAGVLLAVPLLVGLSAVAGLRQVVVSPLGVARRQTPPGMRAIRLVVTLAVLAAAPMIGGIGWGAFIIMLGLGFLSINLAGPWVVGLIGRITTATARGPARLLAGRRLVDDPRAAWRTVSGVALTGFVAGFLGLLSPSGGMMGERPAGELRLEVPAREVAAVAKAADARLTAAGVRATVVVDEPGKSAPGGSEKGRGKSTQKGSEKDTEKAAARLLTAKLERDDPATVDRARTALAGLSPGHSATSPADDGREGGMLLNDVRTGTIVVLTVSFLVAVASAGITAASSILDRRQTYALLRLAGTPLSVLDRARRAETLIPLTVMGGGSVLAGVVCGLPIMAGAVSVTGVVVLVGCLVLGFAGVVGAGALTRPLLRSVTANPAPRPD
ncbi:ABC transporter permease [Spongiactinospora rosea]|uniref:ABC transporter permease n=1 Tax=Spongiactinospora rosea TaxID=2248750 RepID=A0A366LJP5_9ACTN|nr:FtsX-like permease family protein [Spongiactinospora rosea]RBQ14108.1 ABC transporter permease [Spongiactinospora rosea]